MDLRYTAEDEAFRAQVRAWLAGNAPREPLRTVEEKKAWHRKLYEAGYLGMGWPKVYGGREARPIEQAIVVEEMARANAPSSINWAGLGLVGPTLIHHGTDAQRERYLRNILLGDEIWCQLYSEPNAGSDLAALQCRAEIDGDEFVVNGQKIWTSTAPEADLGILLVRTDRDAPKHQGISYLIVDMHQPGIEVRPLGQIISEVEVLRYASLRILSTLEKGNQPGPESSISKLHYSELDKRVSTLILDILGPDGQLSDGVPAAYAYATDGREDAHGT